MSSRCDLSSAIKLTLSIALLLVGAYGALQATAWVYELPRILTMMPGRALTSFNTAWSMLLASVGVFGLLRTRSPWLPSVTSFGLCALNTTAALHTAFQTGFALDDIVAHNASGLLSISSLYTCSGFFLVGVAIGLGALGKSKGGALGAGFAAVLAGAIGLAGIIAHLLQIMPQSGPMGLGYFAFSSSVGLFVLGAAIVIISLETHAYSQPYWIAPIVGALAIGVMIVMSRVLYVRYATGGLEFNVFLLLLLGGLMLSVLSTFSSHFALAARHNLKLVEAKERELLKLNAELEAKVRERTLELEASNAELDRFSAMAAHDLKSPVNSMTQFAELLASDAGDRLTTE